MDAKTSNGCSLDCASLNNCATSLHWLSARNLSQHILLTCTIALIKCSIAYVHVHPHTHTKTPSLSHASTQAHSLISISFMQDNNLFHACWHPHRLPYRHHTTKPMQSYTRSCSFPIQKKNTHRRTDAVGCITCTFTSMQT